VLHEVDRIERDFSTNPVDDEAMGRIVHSGAGVGLVIGGGAQNDSINRAYSAIPAAELRGRRRQVLPRPYVLPWRGRLTP
jgi:hypothetical protein